MKYIKRIILLIAVVFATTLQAQTKVFNSQVRIKQVPLSSSLDSLVTINSDGLLTYLAKSDLSSGGALEFVTEGGNTGIAIKGRNTDNYGDIGDNAVDLSTSFSASVVNGATGDYVLGGGLNNSFESFSIGGGANNVFDTSSIGGGANNDFKNNSIGGGSGNIFNSNSIGGGISNNAGIGSLISGNGNTISSNSIGGGVGNLALGTSSLISGKSNYAPSSVEVTVGSFGTNYTAASNNGYNANDRAFSIANGTDDLNRNEALIVYKSGNAILDGDLTVDNIIGNGSQLTNVDASTLRGRSDYLKDENLINADASISSTNYESISLYQNTTGSTNFPKQFGGSVLFNMGSSYQRTFSIWKDFNDARWYLLDYNSDRTLKSSNEIYHSGNSAPTRTIDESTLQTSATLNSAFPFADNPDGTIVVNKDDVQSFMYIRVSSTQWKAVSLGSTI